jgi:hypothetical protein
LLKRPRLRLREEVSADCWPCPNLDLLPPVAPSPALLMEDEAGAVPAIPDRLLSLSLSLSLSRSSLLSSPLNPMPNPNPQRAWSSATLLRTFGKYRTSFLAGRETIKAENLVAVDARPEEARGYICLCLLLFFSTCRVWAGGR